MFSTYFHLYRQFDSLGCPVKKGYHIEMTTQRINPYPGSPLYSMLLGCNPIVKKNLQIYNVAHLILEKF